jgi:NAD(P)-dependent dehydrogenase (short-subunit alcohol dehydrogenase family)
MLTIELKNKVALVIGGSRGIGAAITEHFCQAGAKTVFTHTGKTPDRVEELLTRTRSMEGSAHPAVVDACDSAQTNALVADIVKEHGRIDILVCNVGQNCARTPEETSDAQWQQFIDINLSSAFYGVRAVLPAMQKNKFGRIILIGSSAAYDGGGGVLDYAAAKSALNGMMLYLCKQYARKGILTNVIHPCIIDTDLLKDRYGEPEKRKQLIAQIPAGRFGKPEDIAGIVTYLASSWGDYICGQDILVDGGRTFFK